MSKLYATLRTDKQVIEYLGYYKDVTTITTRNDGGLDIEVKSKSYHKDKSDYGRIKNYLRMNAFTPFSGTHSRPKLNEEIRGEDYVKTYNLPDNVTGELSSVLSQHFNKIVR